MKDYSYLYNIRNILKNQINKLHQSKVLTNVQVKNLLKKVERGHQTTLEPLLKTLFNVKGKTTLSNIYAGKSEAVKKQYNVSDRVFYRTNKKIFGKSKVVENGDVGGMFMRKITPEITITNDLIDEQQAKRMITYDRFVSEDMNFSNRQLNKHHSIRASQLQFMVAYIKPSVEGVELQTQQENIDIEYLTNCMIIPFGIQYSKEAIELEEDTVITNEQLKTMKNKMERPDSRCTIMIIGFKVVFKYDNVETKNEVLSTLRAFSPSNCRSFHSLTCKSTHIDSKLCIYESFIHINNYNNQSNYFKNYTINQRLEKEGVEINDAIINGFIFVALPLFNVKYNIDCYVIMYPSLDILYINKDGDISSIKDCDVPESDKLRKVYLYDREKEHVAPAIYNNVIVVKKEEIDIIEESKKAYKLQALPQPKKNVDIKDITDNTIAFDFETFINDNEDCVPYCCSVYGLIKGENISKVFYGLNCADDFITWLLQYKIAINHNKNTHWDKMNYIRVYGFNNSGFDNKFIISRLTREDKTTECLLSNGSIKTINYNNIKIYDLHIIYTNGSLNKVCESMGLGSKIDFDTTSININNYIDNKDIVSKYCLNDSIMTHKLAIQHINNSIGVINNKKYNTLDCPTIGSISKKIYQQVFQDATLFASPKEEIINAEKASYYGGRCMNFKPSFEKVDEPMNYYDINSSYPFQMCKPMPYMHKRTVNINMVANMKNYKKLDDTTLYYISSYKYLGNDDNIINCIVERDENNATQSYKNYNKNTYHWGVELKASCIDNFEFQIYKYSEYDEKTCFKSFVDYSYGERLKYKNTDVSRSLYFKNVLNNLYGKFAQKSYNSIKIVNNFNDIFNYVGSNMEKYIDYTPFGNGSSMGILEYKCDKEQSNGALTRFSSYISALGRVHLHTAIRTVGFDSVYYVDTDSIFTTKKLPDEMISNHVLGKFKLECQIEQALFVSPKVYFYKTNNDIVKKSKGIKSYLLTLDDYENINNGEIVNKEHTIFKKQHDGVKIIKQQYTLKSNHKVIKDT
jgi:hypothetical protein